VDSYLLPAASIVGGLIVLILGAELLIRGASGLAARLGLSPLLIGLTVVAVGTSAPELAVSVMASHRGESELVIGNIVGSNTFNVLFILGLSALIAPLAVASRLVRVDVPLMILSALAMLGLGWNGVLGRWQGAVLLGSLVIYLAWMVFQARREQEPVRQEFEKLIEEKPVRPPRSLAVQLGWILFGLGLLAAGSRWMVGGAVALASLWGVGQLLIGLTIVAMGTSLPEVVTSVLATVRGHRDIAVGNIVGSNIFNVLGILGISALIAPQGLGVTSAALGFDIPMMIAASILCLPIFFSGSVVTRWEGLLFLAYYAAYITYLILLIVQPGASTAYAKLIIIVGIPATVILVMIGVLKTFRRRRPTRPLRHRIRGI
jgi:cation:H+ antiporter